MFNKRDRCPRCDSDNVSYGETIYDENVSREVICWDCDFVWWEIFTFSFNEIEEFGEGWDE